MKRFYLFTGLLITTLSSPSVHSAAYSLHEQGASGLAQAFAGSSVVAEDTSTLIFNPAGMSYLDGTQLSAGNHIMDVHIQFKDDGTSASDNIGTDQGGEAAGLANVPYFLYVTDWQDYKFGLAITSPFGLMTDYDSDWMGRYAAIETSVLTLDINPSIAYRVNDKLAIGFGIHFQYFEAELSNAINVGTGDGESELEGDDWTPGFSAGLIYQWTTDTRLGISYRTAMKHELSGDAVVTGTGVIDGSTDISADINLPSYFSVSLMHNYSNSLSLLADITRSEWSKNKELIVTRDSDAAVLKLIENNWDNNLRYALGFRYQYNDQWTWRAGIALDKTPIDDNYRTASVPSDTTTAFNFGFSYKTSSTLSLDLGFSHQIVDDNHINEQFDSGGGFITGSLNGEYDSEINIIAIQANWKL